MLKESEKHYDEKICLYNQNFYNQMVLKQIGSNVRLQKNVSCKKFYVITKCTLQKKSLLNSWTVEGFSLNFVCHLKWVWANHLNFYSLSNNHMQLISGSNCFLKNHLNWWNDVEISYNRKKPSRRRLIIKGTLMQIWKSANFVVFIWK